MTTFNADGSMDAAPADEQLVPTPEYCATDNDGELAETSPDAIDLKVIESEVSAIAADQEDIPKPGDKPSTDVEVLDDGNTVVLAARFDITTTGEQWPYDFLEFMGDKLGIRLPTRQALAAFSLASSKYVSLGVKNDLTGLFIARHLSPESYGRVFSRLMDPDENDYDVDTVGELFNAIVTAAVNADKADAEKGDGAK